MPPTRCPQCAFLIETASGRLETSRCPQCGQPLDTFAPSDQVIDVRAEPVDSESQETEALTTEPIHARPHQAPEPEVFQRVFSVNRRYEGSSGCCGCGCLAVPLMLFLLFLSVLGVRPGRRTHS